MSIPLSSPSLRAAPASRSRLFVAAIVAYGLLFAGALATGSSWLDGLAALAFVSLVLSAGLRRGKAWAWVAWLAAAAAVSFLAATGRGRIALDLLPVLIDVALCILFARTLLPGRTPLIAVVIEILEGAERLALRRVSGYARALTWAWTLLFAAQAAFVLLLVACKVPGGLLAAFGLQPPLAIAASGWVSVAPLAGSAVVVGFMVIEYLFRRWYLGHIPHAPLPRFIADLARRWPALIRRFAIEAAGR